MDVERKVNLEGVPLNSPGAANIFLNTGNNTKVNSPNGTVIHLKSENSPADLGLHINTTFSVASSKKIKVLFILNFLLCVICIIISCSVAFYYWNEMSAMRRQLDAIKEQLIIQNLNDSGFGRERMQAGALVAIPRPIQTDREARMDTRHPKDESSQSTRKYYVENLGSNMLLIDMSKKDESADKVTAHDRPAVPPKNDMLVSHFSGAIREINLGKQAIIGPWSRDGEISSKSSEGKIELHENYVTIQETGLYLVYAQIVYLGHAPNCYFIWARQNNSDAAPRLVSSCSSGDDSSRRALDKSQISCSTSTVARLYQGDIVNLSQREHNRTLWLRPGYSYWGFVKLSS